jgi:hypothetical protein
MHSFEVAGPTCLPKVVAYAPHFHHQRATASRDVMRAIIDKGALRR